MSLCAALAVVAVACGTGEIGGASDMPRDPIVPPEPGLYLRGAQIVTGLDTAATVGNAVIVRGATIEAIEPERAEVPEELEIIDLDGMTLMPGLIDSHVHIAVGEDDEDRSMAAFLDYGITTVKDVASDQDVILALRDEILTGTREGPRIYASGAAFTAPGGHPISTIWPSESDLVTAATRQVDDPDVARAEVRALHTAGVDLIKCVVTDCGGSCPRLTYEVLAAITDEAHGLGLMVVAHTDTNQDVDDALNAGVDGLEHGFTAEVPDPLLLQALATDGVFVVPTISVTSRYALGRLAGVIERLHAMRQAGVLVALGSDAENVSPFGSSMHEELTAALQAGYSPIEVIGLATRAGAEYLRIDHEVGTIAPGKRADLIAVQGDPLSQMSDSENVRWVFQSGIAVREPPI